MEKGRWRTGCHELIPKVTLNLPTCLVILLAIILSHYFMLTSLSILLEVIQHSLPQCEQNITVNRYFIFVRLAVSCKNSNFVFVVCVCVSLTNTYIPLKA